MLSNPGKFVRMSNMHYSDNPQNTTKSCAGNVIAIIVPVSSRKSNYRCVEDIDFFKILLPSFLNSLISDEKDKFNYSFYLGYDAGDSFYDNESILDRISAKFRQAVKDKNIVLKELVKCHGTEHSPAYVWNILFKRAYNDGCDYFYQLGDDIELITAGWSSVFVEALAKNKGVGVTGPLEEHNRRILTQTFVSRTHMDIFGYYFTPIVKNWSCDDWLHNVYMPSYNFWRKDISVKNSSVGSTKYDIENISSKKLKKEIKQGRKKIKNWMKAKGFVKLNLLEKIIRCFSGN